MLTITDDRGRKHSIAKDNYIEIDDYCNRFINHQWLLYTKDAYRELYSVKRINGIPIRFLPLFVVNWLVNLFIDENGNHKRPLTPEDQKLYDESLKKNTYQGPIHPYFIPLFDDEEFTKFLDAQGDDWHPDPLKPYWETSNYPKPDNVEDYDDSPKI